MDTQEAERRLIRAYRHARVVLCTLGIKLESFPMYLAYSLSLADLINNYTSHTLLNKCQETLGEWFEQGCDSDILVSLAADQGLTLVPYLCRRSRPQDVRQAITDLEITECNRRLRTMSQDQFRSTLCWLMLQGYPMFCAQEVRLVREPMLLLPPKTLEQ